MERLTSGFKINSAKDNAANYSISSKMTARLSSYGIASDNVAMGIDLVSTADGMISEMLNRAERLNSLSLQARNGTYGGASLDALNTEAQQIVKEIDRLYSISEFNGVPLFSNPKTGFTLPSYLPRAGANGFIEATSTPVKPQAEYNGFIDDSVDYAPEQIAAMPSIPMTSPVLQAGTEYSISSPDELYRLTYLVNRYGVDTTDVTFVLAADIDLSAYDNWLPIGGAGAAIFKGSFNGNGHTIKNLTINRSNSSNIGLFGNSSGGIIKNVSLENVNIIGGNYTGALLGSSMLSTTDIVNCKVISGSVVGKGNYTGGLVGRAMGTSYEIVNSYSKVEVQGEGTHTGGLIGAASAATITNSFASGDVQGAGDYVGGLVGYAGGATTVVNSYATGNVKGESYYIGGLVGNLAMNAGIITNCYATGDIEAVSGQLVGGLVGISAGTITSSYSSGNITGAFITAGLVGESSGVVNNCYAIGDITGRFVTAGLVGQSSGVINNCYATGDVSGTTNVGGLVGRSSSDISNSLASGNVTAADRYGSFIGTAGTSTTITNCQVKSQEMAVVGNSTDPTLLAGIQEIDITPPSNDNITNIQVGIKSGKPSYISLDTNFSYDLSAIEVGIESDEAMAAVKEFIEILLMKATELGAVENRLESTLDSLAVVAEKVTSSRSTLLDADLARESSNYVQQQILQQASATLLSTANQMPTIALQLLKIESF